MTWQAEIGRVRAVAWKDLTAERRTKANFNAVAFMGMLVLLLFGFALGPDTATVRGVAPGILWLAVLFSGVLAFNRSYQLELEGGALESLLLYPGERWALFVGKLIANLTFILLVELVIVPVAVVLYQLSIPEQWPLLLLVLFLGTVGFATLGTFYAAMASRSRAREVLLPLLLFPMLVPLLIAATEASAALLEGDPMGNAGTWIRLLLAFDVVFLGLAIFAFEHVIEV
ncbi:MAG TPA: heme exporter protein CcmB [Gemmatimonadaceae bacterium]|nr:heme exporter protein CcmB [Gemmatimonadaceae bacterium]